MIKIEKILKLCEEAIPENIEYIGPGYRIKQGGFMFDAYSLSWSTYTNRYEVIIHKENDPERLKEFVYIRDWHNKKDSEGDKRVEDCHVALHKKFLEWKDYQKKLKKEETERLRDEQKYEEEQEIKSKEEQKAKDLEKLERLLS